jgi:hypothetical protein
MKIYKYQGVDLGFSYPDNWVIEKEENIVSIYDPLYGIGALQFSFYLVANPQTIFKKDELEDYIRDRHDSFEVTVNGNCAFSTYLDDKKGRYWKYWLFLKNKTLLFAFYNCQKEDVGKEEKIIDEIIASAQK